MDNKEFSLLIGLEIHITLKTKNRKKIFNWIDNYQNNLPPNQLISSWELGYLGTLPILNPECVKLALKLATVFNMFANSHKKSLEIAFDRKGYFYHDLPKWYQITQYYQPLAKDGFFPLVIENNIKNIPIKSIHLEEDTAKSFYTEQEIELDFNRSGNPLIELTTDPIFSKSEEVIIFIKQLQNLCHYLEISEAKMEKGQLRVDLNFSLKLGEDYQTPRYEIKNLNSLKNISEVLKFEISKHKELFNNDLPYPSSQTFGFDEKKKVTIPQREKINYFYLPEVNIPVIKIKKQTLEKISKNIPVLPWIKWSELREKKLKNLNYIIENPLLLKTVIFLEIEGKMSVLQIDQWITFFLNYLHFLDNLNSFKKNWKNYWQIFKDLSTKELNPDETKLIIEKLKSGNKNLTFLKKKYQKKKAFDNHHIISLLKELWDEETKRKYLSEPQKIKNYLLGQIKKRIPKLNIHKANELINNFVINPFKF